MKNLMIVIMASFVLGGCATSNDRAVLFEPYSMPKYNKPFLNEVMDSTVSIVRTGSKGAINRRILKETTRIFY